LPGTTSYKVVLKALENTGFEVLEYEDFFANRSGGIDLFSFCFVGSLSFS
jgi:hypothetical protein